MEGPLSRVKSLKKSLRQSFRRIRKSRVSGKKRAANATSKVSWGLAARVTPGCLCGLGIAAEPGLSPGLGPGPGVWSPRLPRPA